jgi:hypothetical protein
MKTLWPHAWWLALLYWTFPMNLVSYASIRLHYDLYYCGTQQISCNPTVKSRVQPTTVAIRRAGIPQRYSGLQWAGWSRAQTPVGTRDSPFFRALGPTQPSAQWVTGLLLGGKAAEAWRWSFTPFRAKHCTSTPPIHFYGVLWGYLYWRW